MSDTSVQIAQETKRPWVKPLPKIYHTVDFRPAEPGYVAYYYNTEMGLVTGVEVVMWVLVEYELESETPELDHLEQFVGKEPPLDDLEMQEIRPFLVTTSGAVVDYLDSSMGPFQLVCVCGPKADHQLTIKQHLADLGLSLKDKPATTEEPAPPKPPEN